MTQSLEVGGQEKLLVEFARHADRGLADLRFVCLGGRGALASEIEKLGWPVAALNMPPGLWPGTVPRLARLLRRMRCDVLHTHNNRPLIYGAPAARLAGIQRIVHTQHGRGFGLSRRQMQLTRWAAKLARPFVCVSEDSALWMVENGIPAARIRVLWNGIDLERFAFTGPRPSGPAVCVARLSPEKDVATLLHSVALVLREVPGFELEIAGDGPCRAELHSLAASLGVERSIRFLGMTDDVASVLKSASMFVLPSITEGISLTLLEAMARGLPVVATRVGGTPEVVADGATGILVPPSQPRSLAQAILKLQHDPVLAKQMGVAGRVRVEKDFDIRGMIAKYESLYVGQAALPVRLAA
ncbi:MAG: glycosyltransferase [Planctomycetes bacterium]|nr:glycosyltransferase [Planctomycetota bacterium]